MELEHGQTRLELEFDDGNLRRWSTRDERNDALELGRYDGRAAWIRARSASRRRSILDYGDVDDALNAAKNPVATFGALGLGVETDRAPTLADAGVDRIVPRRSTLPEANAWGRFRAPVAEALARWRR
jgi:hypothetical protein